MQQQEIKTTSELTVSKPYRKPNKRPYKKSTKVAQVLSLQKGCTSCKARKIKCDEARPICLPCQKRFVVLDNCIYESKLADVPNRQNTSRPLQASMTESPTGRSSSNILELRLLYHFTQTTCSQSSPLTSTPLERMWDCDIPMVAFSSDIVLDAMLAISALDLSSRNPDDKAIALASRQYLGKAISKHRMALVKIDSQNAIPLILAAVLITHHEWLSAHCQSPEEPYSAELNTFSMCDGIIALTELVPELQEYKHPMIVSKPYSCYKIQHSGFLASALDDAESFWSSINLETLDESDVQIYDRTLKKLIEVYYLIADETTTTSRVEQAVITFLHMVPRKFVELVNSHQPIALALWVRSVAIMDLVGSRGSWWVQGSGQCKVAHRVVFGIQTLMASDMAWAMEWPLKVISGEIKLAFETNGFIH